MRHYQPKRHRLTSTLRARRDLRDNPLKPKLLNKRLEELQELRLTQQYLEMLRTDLSGDDVDPANAIYVLEWWKARLSLLLFLEITDEQGRLKSENKAYDQLLGNLQRYAFKYKLSAYDLALDGELQIDYWNELQHFIQMSGANPYFRIEWPMLHKVTAEWRTRYWDEDSGERVTWLGKLAKENTKLSNRRGQYDSDSPAIKLLRGAYIGDPVGAEENTEIPKDAIILMDETQKPSDVIAFLKDAEQNLQTSTFFIPEFHQPFLTFPDGKVWTVIASEDKENEKRSLGDCATGEYSDSSLIVISLREPVMSTPQGTYYRTRLRAEIVFPSNISGQPSYEEFKNSVGVVNQLRGSANSKPSPTMHKYIVPLMEQPWIAQLIRPAHRPDDIFWLSDLSPEDRAYLQSKNPKLFDARGFYEQLKNLDFHRRIEEKIMEGIDFPTSYVIEILSDINVREFDYHGGSPRSGVVTRALRRRLQEKLPDPELQQLLQAAEDSVLRLQSKEVAAKYHNVGFELSPPRILEILQHTATRTHPLLKLACESLAEKIKRKEEGLEPIKELVRQRLLEEGAKIPNTWPPREHKTSEAMAAQLLEAGVVLRPEQVAGILENTYSWETTPEGERTGIGKYFFHLALRSLAKLTEENQDTSSITPILEKIALDPGISYHTVVEVLKTDAVELTEEQICDLLSEEKLLPGRTLTAFLSLKAKVDSKTLTRPQRTLKIAQQAMLRLKEKDIVKQTLPWIELPVRSIIKVLAAPRMHPTIRDTAIEAIRLKINHGDNRIRNQAFNAIKKLMMQTKNKSFIRQLLLIYDGHQHQYRLFHRFLVGRLDWLTLDRNRNFLLNLIENSLPKDRVSYRYTNSLPKPLYRLLRKIVADDLIQDNCTFLLKLLFDVNFNDASLRAVRALLEVILDVILKDPKKLTPEMCSWYQRFPAGWGSTEHKVFQNTLPLSPKLLRQFIGLLKITQSTGDDCYLDLAVTIAARMDKEDKAKLQRLTLTLVKGSYSAQGRVDYQEYISKLLPRRLRRRRNG